MKTKAIKFYLLAVLLMTAGATMAQVQDTTRKVPADSMGKVPVDSVSKVAAPVEHLSKIDSVLKYHSPKKAAIRSAIIPGWGQVYNKKYWKLPIVYGALGTAAYVFFFNLSTYKELKHAVIIRSSGDTAAIHTLSPTYQAIDFNALKNYRNEYRQNIDYSVLVFILLWGLNVADAAVDAHLKSFDISPDLTFRFKLGHSEMAGTNGVSLVLAFK
jgi:hypothetical protein